MAIGDNSKAQRSLVYRPWRVWVNETLAALGCSAPVAVLIWVAYGAPWGYVAVAVVVAVVLLSGLRALRIDLVITDKTVRVDNYWTTNVIPWAEIEGVGIGLKGWPGRPALLFRRRGQPPVLAMATPARQQEWRDLRTAILELAPSSVQRDEDAPLRFGFLGADSAISNRLRLWWLGEPMRPDPQTPEQVWPEQPFGFSLLLATFVLLGAALALVLGVSLFVGSITSGAPGSHYLVAFFLVAVGCLGCAALLAFRRRMTRRG